jgi:hypothetical protein
MSHKNPIQMMLEQMRSANEEEGADCVFPMREAQRDFLRQIVERVPSESQFEHGDFVSYLPAAGPLTKAAREGLQLMFWRMLTDSAEDRIRIEQASEDEIRMLPLFDCLLILFDGKTCQVCPSCTALLVKDAEPC